MEQNLFVYGTIHPDLAPAEIAHVVRHLKPVGQGTVRARLRQLKEYPALKLDSASGKNVKGVLFRVPSSAIMSELDRYEEYDPRNKDNSLFRRKRTRVQLEDGTSVSAWVYEYNRHLPESPAEKVKRMRDRTQPGKKIRSTGR